MIRYSLSCEDGHPFEAWFASSVAFEEQRGSGLVSCPLCASTKVEKMLMAPSVSTSRRKRRSVPERESVPVAANVPSDSEAAGMLRKLRERLIENAEHVGDKFAEEARRIHYNEAEKRGIYGQATSDEARALVEEGIEFHPLPVLPEDHN